MNDSPFIPIKTLKHLEAVLNYKVTYIEDLIVNGEKYYYISRKPKTDEKGQIKFDEAGNIQYRTLNPSKGELKILQKRISERILSKIPLPPNIKGGVKGYTNIANARVHLGKLYKFKTDMKSYFPSIHPDKVYEMFILNGFSSQVTALLTHLTTHMHQVPQGIPTSTYIANLVFVPNDLQIIDFCKAHDITYTRYVDDLVFSSPVDFRDHCDELISFILNDGFAISCEKTLYKKGSMEITGVLTKHNIADATDAFKVLLKDESIPFKKTKGRIQYYDRVRKSNKRN